MNKWEIPCRNCESNGILSASEVDQLVTEQLAVESNLVPTSQKRRRLLICESCPNKQGPTCQQCGCFVAFRASLSNKACPNGYW